MNILSRFTKKICLILCVLAISTTSTKNMCCSEAWSTATTTTAPQTTKVSSRRAFFQQGVAGAVMGITPLVLDTFSPNPAIAAVDDLAMPSEDEQKAAEEEAMKERLRRKAELQKAATKPNSYGESFKSERAKQSEMDAKTKEERRQAMCESLGRGC